MASGGLSSKASNAKVGSYQSVRVEYNHKLLRDAGQKSTAEGVWPEYKPALGHAENACELESGPWGPQYVPNLLRADLISRRSSGPHCANPDV